MCKKKSFTLVELLIVVSIIAILISLLQPAIRKAIYKARIAKCMVNLKNITNGVLMYCDDNNDLYPGSEAPQSFRRTSDSFYSVSLKNQATYGGFNILGSYVGGSNYGNTNDLNEKYNETWKCPQDAPGRPTSGYGSNRKSYAVYFNMMAGTNAHYQRSDLSQIMRRLGDSHIMTTTWNTTNPNHGSRPSPLGWPLGFRIIASDTASTWYQHTFNHKWNGLYDTNYSFDNGSVLTFSKHRYSLQDFMHAAGDSGYDKYCLPHIYGEVKTKN